MKHFFEKMKNKELINKIEGISVKNPEINFFINQSEDKIKL